MTRDKFKTALGREMYDALIDKAPSLEDLYFLFCMTKGDKKKKKVMDFINSGHKSYEEIEDFVDNLAELDEKMDDLKDYENLDFGKPSDILRQAGIPDKKMIMTPFAFGEAYMDEIGNPDTVKISDEAIGQIEKKYKNPERIIKLNDDKYILDLGLDSGFGDFILIAVDCKPDPMELAFLTYSNSEYDKFLRDNWENFVYAKESHKRL